MENFSLTCPSGIEGGKNIDLDMTQVYNAERRIQEISFVTSHKAPELLTRFNEAFSDLVRYVPIVKYQVALADKELRKRKSIVILDLVPEILKEKGLATAKSPMGSEDLRIAILEADEEYQNCFQKKEQLKAMLCLLEGKLEVFKMAYDSVKKILGERAFSLNNTNLTAPGDGGASQDFNESNFSKPRY